VAAADFDGDGRMDLAISHPFKPTTLHQNTLKEKRQVAPLRSWIGLTLQGDGVQCNRDAVGSRVQLGAQVREVQTVNGFSGQSDPSLHFGLASERLEGGRVTVKVRWCGQWEEEYRGLAVNRKHSLQMGRSSLSQSKVRE
jgi:hypothetical protein